MYIVHFTFHTYEVCTFSRKSFLVPRILKITDTSPPEQKASVSSGKDSRTVCYVVIDS